MFDISSGELVLLGVAGVTLIGRKDLPKGFHVVGTQLGRVVGLLQGARARADKFASQNELRQLQNELRAGLRELDAVKTELILSTSTPRELGSTVPGANRGGRMATPPPPPLPPTTSTLLQSNNPLPTSSSLPTTSSISSSAPVSFQPTPQPSSSPSPGEEISSAASIRQLAPRSQAVAAVAEEEWVSQGIGFTSKAEQQRSPTNNNSGGGVTGGSIILANLLQETLIYDQYDRVVQEQEDALQSKVDRVQEERLAQNKRTQEPPPQDESGKQPPPSS